MISIINKLNFILIIISLSITSAWSNMVVYPMEANVGSNGAGTIKILSKSQSALFVRVTAKKIIDPATDKEKEITSEISNENSLVITPQKLAIAAGSERMLRLVSLMPPPKETAWRVYVESVPEKEINKKSGSNTTKNSTELGVSIIWGVLVHVPPASIQASLKYNSNTGKIRNDGTVRLPLKEIGVCDLAGKCDWLKETATIYPDTEITLKSVKLSAGKEYRVKYQNWIKNSTEEIKLFPVE